MNSLAETTLLHQTTVYLSLSMATITSAPEHSVRVLSRDQRALLGLQERGPVLELTSLPWAFSLLPSLYGPGSAGSLFCLAPGPASVFHEILGQENLPILIWQAQGHYHFRLGSKQREHWVQSPPFRNGDTGAQRSEGTWPHHLGNLWQNWDIDPDHFPFPSQGFQH